MPIQNVGDMSQHFQSLRQVGEVKTTLNRLSNELATQRKSDVTASLGGATARLETYEREINRLTSYAGAAEKVGQRLAFMQTTLTGVEDVRSAATSQFLGITTGSRDADVQSAAETGASAFSSFVTAFNQRLGDFALFSGAATDQQPLASADDMMADIKASVVSLDSAEDILAAVDTWFDDPMGGFATMGYLGDTGTPLKQSIGTGGTIEINARADNASTVGLLKSAAVAALADGAVSGLTKTDQAKLIAEAGQMMLNAGDSLTATRASIGANEAKVAEAGVTLSAQITAFQIDRNVLTVADPFETATRLQDVQLQLEMQYTVTARLSQLSLVNFL